VVRERRRKMQEAEENTQQLGSRNTYTPRCLSSTELCDPSLKVARGSYGVADLKTLSNNPEDCETREQVEHSTLVFVLNKHGKPLMPCSAGKARRLLKQGKATMVKKTPFTIQLSYGSSGFKQDTTLGIDAGYSKIGYSAVTAGREVIAGELELRKNISKLLEKRRAYRRDRRSRMWYREPRFDNRGGREDGWLAPSLEHKLQSHIRLIEQLKQILPITKVVVEVASFDTQKMQKPEISGVEYQQGELWGYAIREYLLEKWHRKCAYCGKKDVPLEIEHIIPKSRGGSDRVSNLTISCHDCNQKKGNKTAVEFGYPRIQKKARQSLKATAFMNVIRWKLVNMLGCGYTYGYITKYNRIKCGLEKSHINDAFVIAGGMNQERSATILKGKQVRRQNRSLYKANLLKGGRRKRNTVKEVNGFKRWDKVMYGKVKCCIFGLRSSGYFNVKTIEGEKVSDSVSCKKLTFVERVRGRIEEVRRAIPPRAEARGILAHN